MHASIQKTTASAADDRAPLPIRGPRLRLVATDPARDLRPTAVRRQALAATAFGSLLAVAVAVGENAHPGLLSVLVGGGGFLFLGAALGGPGPGWITRNLALAGACFAVAMLAAPGSGGWLLAGLAVGGGGAAWNLWRYRGQNPGAGPWLAGMVLYLGLLVWQLVSG
ncbi:MAG: hypothetical protein LJE84_05575 [Gammaproteobacteria bacterium]|nr:hypothetical protein [Gammaproteobacteria bacterium]